jgi:GT2 family glycosyltransferase
MIATSRSSREGPIIVVVPTYVGLSSSVSELPTVYRHRGKNALVFACISNSERARHDIGQTAQWRALSYGLNLGFGQAINAAVRDLATECPDYCGVLILNDDLRFPGNSFQEIVGRIQECPERSIGFLATRDCSRRVPGLAGVVLRIGGIGGATRRRSTGERTYPSFYCTYISAAHFQRAEGFHASLPLYFEDALLWQVIPTDERDVLSVNIEHGHSGTSKALGWSSLAVQCYSARRYLEICGHHPRSARLAVILGLALRAPLALRNGVRPACDAAAEAVFLLGGRSPLHRLREPLDLLPRFDAPICRGSS